MPFSSPSSATLAPGLKGGSPYDPRGIANLILDQADREDIKLTNLALQKLLYFAHAIFLIRFGCPLVSGYFEAWKFGPVHPTVYSAFKEARDRPIKSRAVRHDPLSGQAAEISIPDSIDVGRHIREIAVSYGRLTPGRLVEVSHAKGGPWHVVFEKSRDSVAFGLRISDNVIRARFKYHKVAIGSCPSSGEPGEDTPPA